MKIPHNCLSLAVVILCCEIASGQGFVNLGFENATLTSVLVNPFSGYYDTNATLPGWDWSPHANAGYSDPNTTVEFNNIALDSPAVTLQGTNGYFSAIRGKYSILLQGGSKYSPDTNGASISQIAQIPVSAQSLTFWGYLNNVSFGGQALSLVVLGSTPNYNIYGADVSGFAGQTGQLVFSVPWQTSGILDNIQFLSSPVPEPSTFALLGLGGLLLGFRSWRTTKTRF